MNSTEHCARPERRPDADIAAVAETQYGLLTRAQAVALGMSVEMVQHRLDTGRWTRVLPGVYRVGGVPRSGRQECMAACLWAGRDAVISHRSAGVLWRLDGVGTRRIEITVPEGVDIRSRKLTVHRTSHWCERDVDRLDGVPITSATRTLVDLAGVVTPDVLELAVEDAFRRGLSAPGAVEQALVSSRGRRGAARLRGLLAERGAAETSESAWEVRVERMLLRHGLPRPTRQHELVVDGCTYRLDLAYVEARVGVEFDSLRWHTGRARIEHDSHRRNAIGAAGWHLVHVTAGMVRRRPELVARLVRDALERSGAQR